MMYLCETRSSSDLLVFSLDVHRYPNNSCPEHEAPPDRGTGVSGISSGGSVYLTHRRQHHNAG